VELLSRWVRGRSCALGRGLAAGAFGFAPPELWCLGGRFFFRGVGDGLRTAELVTAGSGVLAVGEGSANDGIGKLSRNAAGAFAIPTVSSTAPIREAATTASL